MAPPLHLPRVPDQPSTSTAAPLAVGRRPLGNLSKLLPRVPPCSFSARAPFQHSPISNSSSVAAAPPSGLLLLRPPSSATSTLPLFPHRQTHSHPRAPDPTTRASPASQQLHHHAPPSQPRARPLPLRCLYQAVALLLSSLPATALQPPMARLLHSRSPDSDLWRPPVLLSLLARLLLCAGQPSPALPPVGQRAPLTPHRAASSSSSGKLRPSSMATHRRFPLSGKPQYFDDLLCAHPDTIAATRLLPDPRARAPIFIARQLLGGLSQLVLY